MNQDVPENTEVTDGEQNAVNVPCRKLTQSQSEDLLQLTKKYYLNERDCKEKYHEVVSLTTISNRARKRVGVLSEGHTEFE